MPRRAPVDLAALDVLLAQQAGCVTLSQLDLVGMASSTIAYRTRPMGGTWQRVLPGVVLTHRGTPLRSEKVHAALLYAGTGAVLTGGDVLSAAGFKAAAADGFVHVLVPDRRKRTSYGFAVLERTESLRDPEQRHGLPCAPVPRALVDHVRRVKRLDDVRAVTAEALQRRLCTSADLIEAVHSAQRRGTAAVRLALQEVLDGVRSSEEAKIRALILGAGLRRPEWNMDLFTADGQFIGSPDAWWKDGGVALEVNSRQHHLAPKDWEATQRRWRFMAQVGLTIVPVTPLTTRRDSATFLRELRATLDSTKGRQLNGVYAVRRSQAA